MAIGKITKFSHYSKLQVEFDKYNSKELGFKLSQAFLSMLDTFKTDTQTEHPSYYQFSSPKKESCYLPNGTQYWCFQTPDFVSAEGKTLTTTNKGANNFSIVLDKHGVIKQIVYLGPGINDEHTNYEQLIGLHEKYLNDLVSRYEEGLITDFVSYLREWWALGLYHDRFKECLQNVKEMLLRQQSIRDLLHKKGQFTKEQRRLIMGKLLRFMKENIDELPVYFTNFSV